MSAPMTPELSEVERKWAKALRLQLRALPNYLPGQNYDSAPAALMRYLNSPAFIEARKKEDINPQKEEGANPIARKIRGCYIIRPSSSNPDLGEQGIDRLGYSDGTQGKEGTHLIFALTRVVIKDNQPYQNQMRFGIGKDNKIIGIKGASGPVGRTQSTKWDSLDEFLKDLEMDGLSPVTTRDILEGDIKKKGEIKEKFENLALAFSDGGNNYCIMDPNVASQFRNLYQERFKDAQRLAQDELQKSLKEQSAKASSGDSKSTEEDKLNERNAGGAEFGSGGGLWKPKSKEEGEKLEEPKSPRAKP